MEATANKKLTPQEYLAIERKAELKSEFFDGEMFAMAGGTHRHSRIKTNVIEALGPRLRDGDCETLDSDMRVKVEATGLYTYPDLTVTCGALKFEDEARDTLLNPRAIFEVLSDGTAADDRGKKFWNYRQIDSLHDYVLVSQDAWLVEHYARGEDGTWILRTIEGQSGQLALANINCVLPLNEIYRRTDLKPV